jgi:hypothetical protein
MEELPTQPSSFAQSNNIVKFPKNNPRAHIVMIDEDDEERTKYKHDFVDQAIQDVGKKLMYLLSTKGFDITTPEFNDSYMFTMESLRATLLQSMGINHPFLLFIDDFVGGLERINEEELDEDD